MGKKAMKCFDVVIDVVQEACRRFSPDFVLIPDRIEIIEEYCGAIDRIAQDTDAEAFAAEVDEETMTVTVSVEAPGFAVRCADSPFYELIERCVSFGFRADFDGNTEVFFEFPRLWERAEDKT